MCTTRVYRCIKILLPPHFLCRDDAGRLRHPGSLWPVSSWSLLYTHLHSLLLCLRIDAACLTALDFDLINIPVALLAGAVTQWSIGLCS